MDITLNHQEITQAMVDYVASQGISLDGKATEVNFTAGRGGNGYSATISITEPAPTKAKPASKKKTSTRPVSKNAGLNALNLAELDPDATVETTTEGESAQPAADEPPFDTDTTAKDQPEAEAGETKEEATPSGQSSLFG